MDNYYLKTVTVPIPTEDRLVVIRKGERVEYEIDRIYVGNRSTRVKRKVIGKIDPIQPGRMFPNEAYFELFPENEVPEAVRDEFLRECAIKQETGVIRKNPAEVIDGVVRGIEIMNSETRKREGGIGGDGTGYVMLRRVFDEVYYATEEMASRFPNEVMDSFKIERINEVLAGLRTYIKKETGSQDAAPVDNEIEYPARYFRLIEEGLTYSDVLLLMKWYKVLPR